MFAFTSQFPEMHCNVFILDACMSGHRNNFKYYISIVFNSLGYFFRECAVAQGMN